MGGVLSSEEKEHIAPHLLGFQPSELCSLVWDSINEVGMEPRDSQDNSSNYHPRKIGISFKGAFGEAEAASEIKKENSVVFWDGMDTTHLPKRVFLEVLKMTGEELVSTYEQNYELERMTDLGFAVAELKHALSCLDQHISSTLGSQESAGEYKRRLDEATMSDEEEEEEEDMDEREDVHVVRSSAGGRADLTEDEASPEEKAASDEEIADSPLPSASTLQQTSNDDDSPPATPPSPTYFLHRRRSSRGIVGVLDRIPDLRTRLPSTGDDADISPPRSPPGGGSNTSTALDRVKKKVKILSLFKQHKVSPEETPPAQSPTTLRPRPLSLGIPPGLRQRSQSIPCFPEHTLPPIKSRSHSNPGDNIDTPTVPPPMLPGNLAGTPGRLIIPTPIAALGSGGGEHSPRTPPGVTSTPLFFRSLSTPLTSTLGAVAPPPSPITPLVPLLGGYVPPSPLPPVRSPPRGTKSSALLTPLLRSNTAPLQDIIRPTTHPSTPGGPDSFVRMSSIESLASESVDTSPPLPSIEDIVQTSCPLQGPRRNDYV